MHISKWLSPIVMVTQKSIMFNKTPPFSREVSTQEEADTLMILVGSQIHQDNPDCEIHIYAQDTDILLLAIYYLESLGSRTAMIMGHGEKKDW